MSVSSHLTPEPERRLWLIFESLRRGVEVGDLKVAALTAFAAAELAILKMLVPSGPFSLLALAPLAAALPLGLVAFSPLTRPLKWLSSAQTDQHSLDDSLVTADGIAGYSHNELIHRLDKYLGGGITATQYYEDLVGQILATARVAVRKQRLFQIACWVVGLGQLGLIAQLIGR